MSRSNTGSSGLYRRYLLTRLSHVLQHVSCWMAMSRSGWIAKFSLPRGLLFSRYIARCYDEFSIKLAEALQNDFVNLFKYLLLTGNATQCTECPAGFACPFSDTDNLVTCQPGKSPSKIQTKYLLCSELSFERFREDFVLLVVSTYIFYICS